MKVYLATDHAGFELKEKVKKFLKKEKYTVEDCGAYTFDKNDDYPDFISKAAQKVSIDPQNSKAIVFGGSGQGEAMVANKYPGVRCSLFYSPVVPAGATDITGKESSDPFEMLRLTREHNDANCLSLGVRFLKEKDVLKAIKLFLESSYSGEKRHMRRIEKIKDLEQKMGCGC